jgi:hypothetical protein
MRTYATFAVLFAALSAGCMTSSDSEAIPAGYREGTDRAQVVDRQADVSDHLWQVERSRREYKVIHDPSPANRR